MQLLLALKAAAFAVLFYFAGSSDFFLLLFILASSYFYYRNYWNAKHFLASFVVLLAICLIALWRLGGQNALLSTILAVFFGVVFFMLLGIKNMIFSHRTLPYYFLNTFLFAAALLAFFSADKSSSFVLEYLGLGAASFLLFREFLNFNYEISLGQIALPILSKRSLKALVFAFLVLELSWIVALLPIGFLNATSLALLFILLLEDLSLHNWNGTLTRRIALRDTTFFIVISFVIMVFSRWSP